MGAKQPKPIAHKIELRADGWERFRAAVHAAAKSGPKHRQLKDAREECPASKERKLRTNPKLSKPKER